MWRGKGNGAMESNQGSSDQSDEEMEVGNGEGQTESSSDEEFTSGSECSESSEEVSEYEEPPGGKYYGRALVWKVYDDMRAKKGKDEPTGWTQAVKQAQREKEECQKAKEESVKEKPRWTIPEVKGIIMMPPVEKPSTSYSFVKCSENVVTANSNFLANIPYVASDKAPETVRSKFEEELVDMYDGRLYLNPNEELLDSLPVGLDHLDYIRVLMTIGKFYGNAIFSNELGEKEGRKAILKPSKEELDGFYKMIDIRDREVAKLELSKELVALLTKTVFAMLTPSQLRTCYKTLAEKRNSKGSASAEQVKPDVDKLAVQLDKEELMDSYNSLFCRMCNVYSCMLHPMLSTKEEIQRMHEAAANEYKRAKSSSRTTCPFQDCYKLDTVSSTLPRNGARHEMVKKDIVKNWTATEITLFNCFHTSILDYCLIGFSIKTKTCRQVQQYHQFLLETEPLLAEPTVGPSKTVSDCDSPACPDSPASSTPKDSDEQNLVELYTFHPCLHSSSLICDDTCSCVQKGTSCEVVCNCNKTCKNRKKGCICITTCSSGRCPCFVAHRECDPDLCLKCGAPEDDPTKMTCRNVGIQKKLGKTLEIKNSKISGIGAFAMAAIVKGEFIDEYVGEIISSEEAEKRGHVYDFNQCTYLFAIDKDKVIDSTEYGNDTRFINSSKRPNCIAKRMKVRGEMRVGIYALKDIKAGEELTFDYNEVLENHKMQHKNAMKKTRNTKTRKVALSET